MIHQDDEGLGLSVLVYAIAMIGGLVLFVTPVIWANSAAVYDNPAATTSQRPGGPAYASRPAEFPLAVLNHEQIVNSKMLAELNKGVEKPAQRHRARTAQRSYAQAPDSDANEPRSSRPFFSLF